MSKYRRIFITIILLFTFLGYFKVFASTQDNMSQQSQVSEAQITMDFKDADIKDVLRLISDKGGINIIAGSEVEGVVTMRLKDVPWDKALDMILKTQGFVYERDGNIIRVTTVENLSKEVLETQIFPLNYAKAETITGSLKEILTDRGKIQFDERTNQLIVTDIKSNIEKISVIIEQLDSMTPQILIEARIIETTLGEDERLGIEWMTEVAATGSRRPLTFPYSTWRTGGRYYPEPLSDVEADGFASRSARDHTDFSAFPEALADVGEKEYFQFGTLDFTGLQAVLEALYTRTDTNILSHPRITTLNNQLAKITVGTKWPVATYSYSDVTGRWNVSGWDYIEYGILLDVTPSVNKDGYITLDVKPEISDKQGSVFFEGAEVPIIATKQAQVQVMIKDGHTLVIGGLIKDKIVNTTKKIPILGDIPLLGLLFSKKETTVEKRDLLIFITPHILKETGQIDSVSLKIPFEQEPIF